MKKLLVRILVVIGICFIIVVGGAYISKQLFEGNTTVEIVQK